MALTAQQYNDHLRKFLAEELADEDVPEYNAPTTLPEETNYSADTPLGLKGLDSELEKFRDHEVIRGILDQGCELTEYAREVEDKLKHVEMESIQDYIQESDNLVALHDQVRVKLWPALCCSCGLEDLVLEFDVLRML